MKLTRRQKKYLKKNIRRLSLGQIATGLDISEKEILTFLKSYWRKEKYEKFLKLHLAGVEVVASPPPRWPNGHLGGVNPKAWLFKNKFAFIFLIFLVFVTYLNSLGNEFVSDDIPGIVEDKNIGNLSYHLPKQSLNFLRYFVFWLAYKINNLNPAIFRLFNILFHLGSVFTIYALVYLLYDSFLAIATASIFAVHPLLSESVTWISGGAHSQYSFFVLLSFLFYLLAKLHSWSWRYYLISLVSFLLALLTTEKATPLPLILFVFEFSFGQLRQTWKKIIPFLSLSCLWAFSILTGGLLGQRLTTLQSQFYSGKQFYNPLIQIPTAISSYLKLIFWPDKLTLYHSEMSFSQGQYLIISLTTIAFFGAIIYTFINKKYRQHFFWLSFFVISLLPMLTPFKVAWVVAERYVYLGSLGIFVIIGLGIQKIGNKISYSILAIILVLLSTRTIIRNKDWKNQDTLWLAAARTSPSSPQNHNNLGDYYGRQGDLEKAVEEFEKAIELKPGYADAYHNLANTYQQMGQTESAIANYQKAIEFNPNLWQSHQNLAAIYFNQENFNLAKEEFEKAIGVNQENSNLYANLGLIYLKLNEKENAQQALQQALQLDPQNQTAKELLSD